MKLEEFKEKLFKKFNEKSIILDHHGSSYSIGYFNPVNKNSIKVEASYNTQGEFSDIFFLMRKDGKLESVMFIPGTNTTKERKLMKFLDKVDKSVFLNS